MLRDTIRHIDLSVWPEAALVIFVGVFLLVTIRTIRGSRGLEKQLAAAVLDDGSTVITTARSMNANAPEHAHG